MRRSLCILMAGLACMMMIAAGCTGTSTATPASTTVSPGATTAATPGATTAPAAATPAAETTTAAPATNLSWTGSWNTTYTSSEGKQVIEILKMNQTGSAVTGSYGRNNTGVIDATLKENLLTGTWSESDPTGNYTGMFEFAMAADEKSFAGHWIDATEKPETLKTTNLTWDGVRI